MFVFVRAVTYSTLFIGIMLIFLPQRILAWSGIIRPEVIGAAQVAGMIIGIVGGVIGLACVLAFVTFGKGTPMPLDPPRRLVIRGPYRFVRNPMYLGAVLALGGAALFFVSWPLLTYAVVFLVATHLLVVGYEEPHLRGLFGKDYEDYCAKVGRWLPHI